MVVQDIVDIIQEQTRDDLVTWSYTDMVQYINEAVKNVIQRAPQASSKKEYVTSAAGIEQVLPNDAVSLINVIANGTVSGKLGSTINQTDVTAKDAFSPDWRNSRAKSTVIEWMRRSEPTKFLVWPPVDATGTLFVEYSFYPDDIVYTDASNLLDTIGISNEYLEPVRTWCLYRTFSRDSQNTPSVERSAGYRAEFEAFFK